MARIRTIKPEFWSSEQVADCSPIARLLFVGLWNFSDDFGVHPYALKRIKMEIFPGDGFSPEEIDEWLMELARAGLISTYIVDNNRYLLVTGWHHQKVEKPNHRFPYPNDQTVFDDYSPNGRRTVGDGSPPEGKGMDGKGREKEDDDANHSQSKQTAHEREATVEEGAVEEKPVMTRSEWVLRDCVAQKRDDLKRLFPHADLTVEEELLVAKYRDKPVGADPWLLVLRWFQGVPKDRARASPGGISLAETVLEANRQAARDFAGVGDG